MAKREIGKRPLEPITPEVAVQKIVQTLERLGSRDDRIKTIENAGNKVLPGFRVSVDFVGLNMASEGVRN